VTLGDHPVARALGRGGYPLSSGWVHAETTERSLEALEKPKVGLMKRELSPVQRFARISLVSGIDRSKVGEAGGTCAPVDARCGISSHGAIVRRGR
jgi:hypothetical protein